MAPFDFKSTNHFVASSDGTTLQIYNLMAKAMVHPFSIRKAHWEEVANINMITLEDDDDDDEETQQISYDGLLFFDGHGRIEGTKAVTVLAQHLKRLRLLVNPEGYCFQESVELADFGIHYLRLNDLFSWPHHGVNLATTSVWGRSELKYQVTKPKPTTTADHHHEHGANHLQNKLEELKRLLKEKEDELEKADEVKDEELENLRKEKDEEMRVLRKKKDEEKVKARKAEEALEKLKEEIEDSKESKDEEMEQLRKQLKRKDEEMRILKRKKDKDQEANSKRIDELEKLKEEMEDANEELRRSLKLHEQNGKVDIKSTRRIAELEKQKNEELERITREKNDEIARIKKDLEQCSKVSWAISPSVRYLPKGAEGERVHLTRRRRVPPETFVYTEQSYDFVSSNMPRIEACLNVFNTAQFVDEDSTGWPNPTSFNVLIGSSNRGFDRNNWWFAKTDHPEGGLTMLAYYDGSFSQFSSGPDRTIRLPFHKDASLAPYKPFFLLNVHSFGVKLAFMYRV
uniref:Uncharacterized protein n=1 Tax=Linum usitatissimum TaxID=4006 RepID=G8GJ78_LINUS|nr:hypothetical protein [Linum usitatissimum]